MIVIAIPAAPTVETVGWYSKPVETGSAPPRQPVFNGFRLADAGFQPALKEYS
jgi:hypothetical protein